MKYINALKKLSTLIIRLILDGYSKQRMHVQWNGTLSDPMITTNGFNKGMSYLPLAFIWMSYWKDFNSNWLGVGRATSSLADFHIQMIWHLTVLLNTIYRRWLMYVKVFTGEYNEIKVTLNTTRSVCVRFVIANNVCTILMIRLLNVQTILCT